jgi:hypothetical protein
LGCSVNPGAGPCCVPSRTQSQTCRDLLHVAYWIPCVSHSTICLWQSWLIISSMRLINRTSKLKIEAKLGVFTQAWGRNVHTIYAITKARQNPNN